MAYFIKKAGIVIMALGVLASFSWLGFEWHGGSGTLWPLLPLGAGFGVGLILIFIGTWIQPSSMPAKS